MEDDLLSKETNTYEDHKLVVICSFQFLQKKKTATG